MNRIIKWTVNGALGALCCYLAGQTIIAVSAEMITPDPGVREASNQPAPMPRRQWSDRQVILDRNLFNASTVAAQQQPVLEPEETYKPTKLNLRLLGTAASSDPQRSWAAVEDRDARSHEVVRIGDQLQERAEVLKIERRRIILDNRGSREELSLEEDESPARNTRSRPRPVADSPRREELADRVRRLAEARARATGAPNVEIAGRTPAEIFSSARILPKYEDGQMVGIQLNNVKAGSLFEEIGLGDGDTVTQVNGVSIDSPQGSAQVLREFSESTQFDLVVIGADGQERTLTYEVDE